MNRVEIILYDKRCIVDEDQINLLRKKETLVKTLVLLNKELRENNASDIRNYITEDLAISTSGKIIRLNRRIRQTVEIVRD